MTIRRQLLVFLTLLLPGWEAMTWAQASLAARIPNDANAIVVLDVDKIMASPLAMKENWKEVRKKAVAAGLTILPEAASSFALGAKMDYEFMEPLWELALVANKVPASLPKIATRWQGQIERISGRNAVLLPDDSYLIQLSNTKLAVMRPANRQSVARWLAATDTSEFHELSPYLKEALRYSQKLGTPIIMAMDLEHVASPSQLRRGLEEFSSLQGKDVDVDALATALSSVRGITLGLNFGNQVSGAMLIDFADNVELMKGFAKPLLLEILDRHSAMIDDFADWKEEVSGNRIRVGGQLSTSGVRRVLSFLDTPASLQEFALSPGEQPDESKTAELSSQQYFQSITGLVDDLRSKPKKSGASSSGQVGLWCEKYAKRIDGLPMLDVDPALLDYGKFVSSSLRDAAIVLRNVGGRSRTREVNAEPQYRTVGRWGSYGYYGGGAYATFESPRLDAQNRARIRTEERVQGASSARDIMVQIDEATVDMRRQMVEKYNVEF